uniref:Neuronal pentraxin receptor n=1 Tax=Macaca nemestrina TaxID=9545 RepID=A0A2K6BGN8_MACNE
MKFLAVLLAAGMLAVPLAASPARRCPAAPTTLGRLGRRRVPGPQRSLSALHGAGAHRAPRCRGTRGQRATRCRRAPVSRFLCTPPAACPSGAQQGDAAGAAPGEREELLLLQNTAEQLRQTALQQEARIRADQDTIRELTGKLGRCESGLPRGLQGAGPRRDTMADGPWDSPALILELEDAVRALRDRIDRLEVSAALRRGSRPGGVRGRPAAVAPRSPSLRSPVCIPGTIAPSSLARRGDSDRERGQASGSSAYSPPDAFKISIPIRNNYMYARVRKVLPELYAFTACMWLRSRSSGTGQGTPFSYSVPGQANEIVLLEAGHEPMELLINDKVAQLPLSLKDNDWHHICVAWTTRDGLWSAYQDGELQGSGENLAAWHPIKPHGILILGQEQDTLGGRFDATQAFVGDIAQFNLWDHALTPAQVLGIANCTAPLLGNILPWEDKLVEAFGGATKAAFDVCKGRAKA